MAASRAAAIAPVTDACTGMTSSSATSRTILRTPGSGTTSRSHDPQPRARLADRIKASRHAESHTLVLGTSTISPAAPASRTAHSSPAKAEAAGKPRPDGNSTTANPPDQRTGNPELPGTPRALITLPSPSVHPIPTGCAVRVRSGTHVLLSMFSGTGRCQRDNRRHRLAPGSAGAGTADGFAAGHILRAAGHGARHLGQPPVPRPRLTARAICRTPRVQ
jgi:hypothetical protein